MAVSEGAAPRAEATRRRENTRQRLIEAAAQVFAEVGFDVASVEAICERAGFTRGAFYSNFESKEDLLFALASMIAEQKLERASARVREMADTACAKEPFTLVREILDITNDERMDILLGSEIRARAMRDAQLARTYVAWQEGMIQRAADLIREATSMSGLVTRLPSEEFARVIMQLWDHAAVEAVIAGIAEDEVHGIVGDRIARLATALVEPAPG